MWGLPQKQNARRAYKIRLCGHLRRYKKIVKKTYIISLELSQYIFCIGASDITDLITNTTGVLVGVGLYYLLKKIFKEKTNKIILVLASIITILFVSLIVIILVNNECT